MQNNPEHIHIDLDKVFQIAKIGIIRAALLFSFGNYPLDKIAKSDLKLPDTGLFQWDVFPDAESITDELFGEYKSTYKHLVIRNSLKELSEQITHFYNGLYEVCLWILQVAGEITDVTESNIHTKSFKTLPTLEVFIHKKSLSDKVKLLRKKFKISIQNDKEAFFVTLSILRNIFTHHDGYVPERYTNKAVFTLKWFGADLLFVEPGRKPQRFNLSTAKSIQSKTMRGGTVQLQFLSRKKDFRLGEYANIELSEFKEMCFGADISVGEYKQSLIDFIKRLGLEINQSLPLASVDASKQAS